MKEEPDSIEEDARSRVAGGAGLAFAARLGALIELVSVITFTWAYGATTFGLFAVLWSYVKVATAISDAAMTTTLQRFVPKADSEKELVAGYALKLSFLLATGLSTFACIVAPYFTYLISASPEDAEHLVTVIRIYVWVLPFWTLVEVATACVRATRTFGPEIKVRVFYEQGLRLIAALTFAALGLLTYGLFLAHLASVVLSSLLALRLISKYYNFRLIISAPMRGEIPAKMRRYGFSLMPANIIKKLFSEFPVMYLNFLLPGAAGAAAGGYYAVARKVASALQTVRTTFEYVIAPLASEKEGCGNRDALQTMYAYATRLSVAIILPFGAALILARHDILASMAPEFEAATAAIAILCAGRVLEAMTGPSSALVEMLGHRFLPPLNGIAGLMVLLGLGFYLIPAYGVTGAAISAAVGINTTAFLSFFQSAVIFRLFPYDNHIWRPLLISFTVSGVMLALVPYSNHWHAPYGFIIACAGLIAALVLAIRYGLEEADTHALGKLGRFLTRHPSV